MVVIVDLDDETPSAHPFKKPLHHSLAPANTTRDDVQGAPDDRPNPNVNGFSAALSCYPIVRQLASELDLNTLHDLSRTCRQFRANLLEYRDQLVKHTMHCVNESVGLSHKLAQQLQEGQDAWRGDYGRGRGLTSGKVGKCARDMVGECQKCAKIICRNCTMKQPTQSTLRARHRRLCRTCTKAPLALLIEPPPPRKASGSPSPPASRKPTPDPIASDPVSAFTTPAFKRSPCTCGDAMLWLCQTCGQKVRRDDTDYINGWRWRTRYSYYLGGVGTGAGEGNEGVYCGRGSACLAAKLVEHEKECDAETLARDRATDRGWAGGSYLAQEIEGIGGAFKMKIKEQVLVGHVVKIYEDEKDKSMNYLEREVQGKLRSWCSWCDRVIPGEADIAEAKGERRVSSSSSESSFAAA